MRLSDGEVTSIKNTIHHRDPKARIILFGSRTDDTKKGGDIDIFILSHILTEKDKRDLKIALYESLGEQKIDILIEPEPMTALGKIAMKGGIEL